MLRSRRGVPSAFIIVSLLYFIFVVSSGSSRMIGDDMNGDPGSMLLPLVLSICMFILSSYLFLKEKPIKDKSLSKSEKKIFALTVISCFLYVILYRVTGFVLLSVVMLFLLTYTYSTGTVSLKEIKYGTFGLLFSIIFMLSLYSAGRLLTRFLFQFARNTGLLWLNSSFIIFTANLIVLAAFFVLIQKISGKILAQNLIKKPKLKICYNCVLVSVAAVELLFLIFRQLFLVNLTRGIISW